MIPSGLTLHDCEMGRNVSLGVGERRGAIFRLWLGGEAQQCGEQKTASRTVYSWHGMFGPDSARYRYLSMCLALST